MKTSAMLAVLVLTASTLTLSGCAHRHGHGHHASSPTGHMSHGSKMDRVAMCEKYSKMTADERKAHMEAHHGKMTPEMLQQHEQKMQEKCAPTN